MRKWIWTEYQIAKRVGKWVPKYFLQTMESLMLKDEDTILTSSIVNPFEMIKEKFLLTSALLPPTPLVRSIIVVVTFPSFITLVDILLFFESTIL